MKPPFFRSRFSLGITARLFLAVLFTAVCVVVAMTLAAQWSFNRGFLGYLNEQEAERLEAARPRIIAAYLENGSSWEFLRGERRRWFHLLRPVPAQEPQPAPSPPLSELTGALLRTTLLDENGHFVVGFSDTRGQGTRQPLQVDGRTVGYVVHAQFQSVTAAGDVRFERSQFRASWTMGAVSALLAALVALWVARVLLKPLREMAKATKRLAEGDYSIRVDARSPDEVGQLATDFNQMAQVLERNEAMRRDFMADLSHELRTPLGVLHGELEAMEDGVRPLTRESLPSLQAEVATLNKLVSDLYDLSLAEAGAMTFQHTPLDLVELLRLAVVSYAQRLSDAGIVLEVQCDEPELVVSGDRRRLRQLFSNLLENSLRYTDRGGRLQIAARRGADQQAVLTFSDSAPGVEPEQLQRIFDRFYRVEGSRSRASGGAGLGLAICRRIIEAHGGALQAQPSPLGGLLMTIRMPLNHERSGTPLHEGVGA
ncbi:sensor histidine kinase efflux regulator BaeS [Diaphorobacter aerolatus]|uniref:histidine kinase n=1 Tax=Diaphorobacter aerolatus TaxID=1288495 RepID=A0A7H0GMD1_9BURK|nr:sensor histidine kinase efflux regulator BaeS [Diaphorobacter aerolatus]QNP49447.1 sensor histidine kinase efflux regulator BaeS [Diaphorobacter aerolatus]